MVRSTAISWKIGLAVAALTLPSVQMQALADDEPSETVETTSEPIEPKEVRVILLPPASDDVFASRRSSLAEGAPIIMVKPARNGPITQLRAEPEEIEEDTSFVESPAAPEQPPRVASLPIASDAAIAAPPPEPEKVQKTEPDKVQKSVTPVVIPSLPGRSPFRQTPFKSEIVEARPQDAVIVQQQASEPAPAKGNAASRFLANLWPGKKQASTPVTSTTEGSSSWAADNETSSLAPQTDSDSASIEQADADPKSDKPPIARFLDGIQFWKK